MTKLERLLAIRKLSQKDKKWIHRDIFRILYKDEIWIAAYEKLKKNKSPLALGITTKTMDEIFLERLKRLKEKVCNETYNFKPVKLISILRSDCKKRPLGLPLTNDQIVQKVMRMILDAIYDPVFSEISFGFRTGLGCHDALDHVEKKFRWVDYVIEKDIEQEYQSIDHQILIKIINKRIEDPRFIRLLWKFLKCKVFDQELITYSKTVVPQGSIVSPILVNIYYNELDEFVEKLKKQLETPKFNRKNLKSQKYKSLKYQINELNKNLRAFAPQSSERKKLAKELKSLRMERFKTVSLNNTVKRIEFVRYANDWMIGIAGDRKLANNIKDRINEFIKNTLAQKLHPTKTKITNLRKGNVYFLGYEIFLPFNRPISKYKGKGTLTIRKKQPQLRFDIPVNIITDKYSKRGYFKKLKKGIRPISKASYSVLEDHVIVSHYRSLWLGLLNYYSGCTNRRRLQYIHYLLHMSCAMTLAHRHRTSCSKIFKKHGKTLSIKVSNKKNSSKKIISFPYKTSWRLKDRKWLRKNVSLSLDSFSYDAIT